ncbi:hypothetical protein EUX98_g4953 [Antrodiella citrinella]|uniref:Uncharacterized protein n=1 Tax=Antrodiella citrinella TaxID=2447956 RepID=A0A4S4MV69_9APHY|nr:hypothetical protein EUX98_g4953 [Antrodiella citrinella]
MPEPQMDKPMPPLPEQPSPIPYTVASPESLSSSQGALSPAPIGSESSTQGALSPASPDPSFPQAPPPMMFSPIMNLYSVGVLAQVDAGPKNTKAEKLLDKLDDTVAADKDPKGLVQTGVAVVKNVLNSSGALKIIEAGVNTFVDDIPWLMKGLDEVAKIHPVVTVAVLAFKAVYTMEMTRRENDRRIRSLYVEMKDMIAVLIQLREVKDPDDLGPDGKTISSRMGGLCEKAASDIKDCANACDSYSKKRLVVKVLKGHTWEGKLVGFVGTFTQRKTDFQQALSIHTARTVDAIQVTVKAVEAAIANMDQRMAVFMEMFAANVPPNEMTMRVKIQEKGDPNTVLNNDAILRELNDFENTTFLKQGSVSSSKIRGTYSVKDLKEELQENLEVCISENFLIFERKFTLHQNQLQEQLTKSLQEVIVAVKEGPHDRIKNPELKVLWKDMNWRRNVKASLFVMTLRDHFREKGEEDSSGIQALEDWALKYIDATWMQSIMEAFDDDASGYITIAELNRFTDNRPEVLKWSMPHWIAYWAVGWQLTTQKYKALIEELMSKMFAMVPYLLPENRRRADYYLSLVYKFVAQITMGLTYPNEVPEHVAEKFTPYVEYEEQRLRKNLELIKHDIDALDTVHVVAGGRIEKHLLPIMYLLLSRDFKLFKVAQAKILHDEELWDAADSLMWVHDAVIYRVQDLNDLFKQRKLDVDLQFKKFACGILDYMHDTGSLWAMSKIREAGFQTSKFTLEELNADPMPEEKDVLNYPLKDKNPFACHAFSIYDNTGLADIPELEETNLVKLIQGTWVGYNYNETEYPCSTMDIYHFNPDSPNQPTFSSSCPGHEIDNGPFKLSGSCSKAEDGTIKVTFQSAYEEGKGTEYFIGQLDKEGSLVGYRSWSADVSETNYSDRFIYRRTTMEIMMCRPSPAELKENKYRSLWQYAIKYTLSEVRRKSWSWSHFAERRRIRKQYIKLNIGYWLYGRPLTDDEHKEFLACRKALTPSESVFYRTIREYLLATMPNHYGLVCDGCRNPFGGDRFLCLDCPTPDQKFWDTCDACDMPCLDKNIDRGDDRKNHTPNHDILKLRTALTYRDMPAFYQSGWEALRQARLYFDEVAAAAAKQKKVPDNMRGEALKQQIVRLTIQTVSTRASSPNLRTPSTPIGGSLSAINDTNLIPVSAINNTPHPDSEDSSEADESSADASPSKQPKPLVLVNGDAVSTPVAAVTAAEPDTDDGPKETHCGVCKKLVQMPCWYCTQCAECFLCDNCESKTLLSCLSCHQIYVQPIWFYGGGPDDNFQCSVCTFKKVSPPKVDKSTQHVYTHPLVRCKPRVEDSVDAKEPTTEQRITTLEQRAGDMDTKLDQLVEKFTHMEQTLAMVGETMQLIAAGFKKPEANGSAQNGIRLA